MKSRKKKTNLTPYGYVQKRSFENHIRDLYRMPGGVRLEIYNDVEEIMKNRETVENVLNELTKYVKNQNS